MFFNAMPVFSLRFFHLPLGLDRGGNVYSVDYLREVVNRITLDGSDPCHFEYNQRKARRKQEGKDAPSSDSESANPTVAKELALSNESELSPSVESASRSLPPACEMLQPLLLRKRDDRSSIPLQALSARRMMVSSL